MEEVTWTVSDGHGNVIEQAETKKLPYLSAWKTFSKLPEEEKEKLFNALRGEAILRGFMENK